MTIIYICIILLGLSLILIELKLNTDLENPKKSKDFKEGIFYGMLISALITMIIISYMISFNY